MTRIYIATLGQRPEAVTIAYDRLSERSPFAEIAILHTHAQQSKISQSLLDLQCQLTHAYPSIPVRYHEITSDDGIGLLDIDTETMAVTYYWGVVRILLTYKQQPGTSIDLMVAGGRKEMSIYAAMAASLVLDEYDNVWTVHTPTDIMKPGVFHTGPGDRDRVSLIKLPFLPSRLAPGSLGKMDVDSLKRYLERTSKRRTMFLDKLTKRQQEVTHKLIERPDATNDEIAALLHVEKKTVDRHFEDIYAVMKVVFDFDEPVNHPRQTLLRILSER